MSELAEAPADNGSAPAIPDYLASPNAVFKDHGVQWRYGEPPDYTKTRQYWLQGKTSNHAAGSLPEMVENLVKNWEVEASFKPRLQDWRTIDHKSYTFAMNGGAPQTADHMLAVGTYNAIVASPNEYYSPANSDFAASHKTFKRMMPTFAWEVLEVYSGPPTVTFRWRHWGDMENDYVARNDKGEKVTAKAHGGRIEIFGVTVARVDEQVRLQAVETWMDPMALFRQIAPDGVVAKEVVNGQLDVELVGKARAANTAVSNGLNGFRGGDSVDRLEASAEETHGITKHHSGPVGIHAPACPFLTPSNGKHSEVPHQHEVQDRKSRMSPPKAKPRPQRSSRRVDPSPRGKRKAEIGNKSLAPSPDGSARPNGPKRHKMELATEVSAVRLTDAEIAADASQGDS